MTGGQQAFKALKYAPFPVVAAPSGMALGGGCEAVLNSDAVQAYAETYIGLVECGVGLIPGGGGTQRLPRLMGIQPALMYLMQGKNMSPQEALGLKVVHEVAPLAEIVERAKAWVKANPTKGVQPWDEKNFRFPGGVGMASPSFAQSFMAGTAVVGKQTSFNMNAPLAILSAVYEGSQLPMDTALRVESKYFAKIVADPQAGNMIRSLFISKQAAEKGARRPKNIAPMPPKKIGMLGAGLMGAGVAMVSAQAGIEVVLLDRSQADADKGKQYTADRLAKKRTSPEKTAEILGRIHPTTDYADLKGCDLIIEAVFEDRAIKADVTRKAEAVIASSAILASNTSTLPISGLAEASARPANFIGLHFFSPVDKMPLVEIIRGKATSDDCLARAMDFVKAIRKTPIVVNDSRGFYTSRVFSTYVGEGLALLAEGVKPALIDNAGRMTGMPVGPLALADEVSLELMARIRKQTAADLGAAYQRSAIDDVCDRMVDKLGRLGKKVGKGFYDYPQDGPKQLWAGLAQEFAPAATQPTVEEVRQRLMFIQSVETARCLEEKVLLAPIDADVGAILGWGFPAYLGGPIGQIHSLGLAAFVKACETLAERHGARFAPPQLLRRMADQGERFYDL